MNNHELARMIQQLAHEQERLGANLFAVRSYRVAANALERLETPIETLFQCGGRAALEALPGIGKSVAYTLEAILVEGNARTLERADRGREPLTLLSTLPGVGPRLAEQLRDYLGIRSLESLLEAGQSGHLDELGLCGKRLSGLMAAVRSRLEQTQSPVAPEKEPSLEALLAADDAYRHEQGSSWDREGWRLRARYADTALAHRRGMTRDWVVIEFSRPGRTGQRMIVTETAGDLAGMRVVRGREAESRQPEASRVA